MRRIMIRPRPSRDRRSFGAVGPGAIGYSRFPIVNFRLLGAIAVALITWATLLNPESVQKLAQSRIGRGDLGVQIMSFALSPKGGWMATTDTAGRVTLRPSETAWNIERFLDFPGYASAVAISPDGRSLVAAGIAPVICLWDLSSPASEPKQTMVVPIQRATRMMFSPGGQFVAITTDLDGTILLWDLARQRERMVLHHPSPVVSIAFSPDGRWLAAAGRNDGSILLWNLETGSNQELRVDGTGAAMALAFSPEGALLAMAGANEHHVRLWDVKTGRTCRIFVGHARSLKCAHRPINEPKPQSGCQLTRPSRIVDSIVFVPPGGPFRFVYRCAAIRGKPHPIV
jgi:WD40 repeat protein